MRICLLNSSLGILNCFEFQIIFKCLWLVFCWRRLKDYDRIDETCWNPMSILKRWEADIMWFSEALRLLSNQPNCNIIRSRIQINKINIPIYNMMPKSFSQTSFKNTFHYFLRLRLVFQMTNGNRARIGNVECKPIDFPDEATQLDWKCNKHFTGEIEWEMAK